MVIFNLNQYSPKSGEDPPLIDTRCRIRIDPLKCLLFYFTFFPTLAGCFKPDRCTLRSCPLLPTVVAPLNHVRSTYLHAFLLSCIEINNSAAQTKNPGHIADFTGASTATNALPTFLDGSIFKDPSRISFVRPEPGVTNEVSNAVARK